MDALSGSGSGMRGGIGLSMPEVLEVDDGREAGFFWVWGKYLGLLSSSRHSTTRATRHDTT